MVTTPNADNTLSKKTLHARQQCKANRTLLKVFINKSCEHIRRLVVRLSTYIAI